MGWPKKVLGENRVVLMFPSFVLKFPRIRPIRAGRHVWFAIKKRNWKLLKLMLFRNASGTLPFFVFMGFVVNWNEYRYYRQTKCDILMPTYFSLFGIINVQKRGKSFQHTQPNWFEVLCLATDDLVRQDGHTFDDADNFVLKSDGSLALVDYGDKVTQRIHSQAHHQIRKVLTDHRLAA